MSKHKTIGPDQFIHTLPAFAKEQNINVSNVTNKRFIMLLSPTPQPLKMVYHVILKNNCTKKCFMFD